MGRLPKEIDMSKLLEMAESEIPNPEIAKTLGISIPTLKDRIQTLRDQQGIILDTKSVENLRVIRMKEKVLTRIESQLHAMEPDDLFKALNALNKMDTPAEDTGKVKGLLGLLTAIDEEAEKRAEEKIEERDLESKTIEVTSTQFPKL